MMEKMVQVITPPTEVTNVDASAAGATSDARRLWRVVDTPENYLDSSLQSPKRSARGA